jgi:hypothetical protein
MMHEVFFNSFISTFLGIQGQISALVTDIDLHKMWACEPAFHLLSSEPKMSSVTKSGPELQQTLQAASH